MSETARRIPVYVVVPARALLLDIAGPLEALRVANRLQGQVRFEVNYIGALPQVTSSVGLTLSGIQPLPDSLPDDAMLVLSGDTRDLMGAPETAEDFRAGSGAVIDWLGGVTRPGITLVCICSGALLAARAGLLDGKACTTHFIDCPELALLAPGARVLDDRLFVEDGQCFTSAGITAGLDLMLHIVARLTGPAVAAAVARHLVVYFRRDEHAAQLSPWLEGRNHLHPAVHRAQDAIAADPAHAWTLPELARIAATSSRHLSRLFAEAAGMSVIDYVNRLRVALARELVSQTRLDMERVAERAGFASSRQLRRAWGRLHATPPSALRQ